MSQKRKAYKDMRQETLNRLVKSYNAATTQKGLDLIKRESKTRIHDKSLVRLLDTIYTDIAILIINAENDMGKIS